METQKVIPIEQGLKPKYFHHSQIGRDTQKVIPIEQGLKPAWPNETLNDFALRRSFQ